MLTRPVSQSLTENPITIANEEIYRLASQNPTWTGMGSTIVAAVLQGENQLYVANVGDSRAYLVRGDEIRQITKDHSWVQQQVDSGMLTPEDARRHPRRSAITRSLGRRPDVEVDIFDEQFFPDDKLILCSDGLSDVVRDEEIEKIVSEYKPQEAVEKMVDLANHRGGPDNITAIAISYPTGIAGPTGIIKKIALGLGILAVVVIAAIIGRSCIITPPTPTPALTPTPTLTTTPTPSPTSTMTPTSPPPTATGTPTVIAVTSTPTLTASATPSEVSSTAPKTTPISTPTPTPSPTPKPTSTLEPTATSTPTPPPKTTSTYTSTPTKEVVAGLLPAPTLKYPEPGANLDIPSVILRWEWTRDLVDDEWFIVSIHGYDCPPDMPESQRPQDRTEKVQVYELQAPLGVRGCTYAWKVVVMREEVGGALVKVSEPSTEWSFWWVWHVQPTPTPTGQH